ncbi:MAG: DUF5698 domain-containing protein [Candidatus Buchananbacteria bacterium]
MTAGIILFFVGVVEMLVATLWTKAVTETKVWSSGAITMVNILIWYYVVQTIVDNVNDWSLALLYALGCALGTMVGTYYYQVARKKIFRLRRQKKQNELEQKYDRRLA